jgi:hypothetical protein
MIISHKYKFIFIKTAKTAGTSIELALSKYCGEEDIITKHNSTDEKLRNSLGYRGPQNYYIPLKFYSFKDFINSIYKFEPLRFRGHTNASFIISHIDKSIWDNYFKFCFERNPWDKAISLYYWRYKKSGPRPSLSEFISSGEAYNNYGYDLYSISDKIVVDKIFFFENLHASMIEIKEFLNLPEVPVLPFAKTGSRKDKRSYKEVLSKSDQEFISNLYHREIAAFHYEF